VRTIIFLSAWIIADAINPGYYSDPLTKVGMISILVICALTDILHRRDGD